MSARAPAAWRPPVFRPAGKPGPKPHPGGSPSGRIVATNEWRACEHTSFRFVRAAPLRCPQCEELLGVARAR